jgi:hypothetical protein
MIIYHCSVRSGKGPFKGSHDSILIYEVSASANKIKIAVLKKVAMKMENIIVVISAVSSW